MLKQPGARMRSTGTASQPVGAGQEAISADGIDAPPLNYWIKRPLLRCQMPFFRRTNGELRVVLRRLGDQAVRGANSRCRVAPRSLLKSGYSSERRGQTKSELLSRGNGAFANMIPTVEGWLAARVRCRTDFECTSPSIITLRRNAGKQ
jgi:hypothetical protein